MPSFQRAAELNFRAKALHEAMVAVLALRRWCLEKGQYPETLNQLVKEGYLKALPDDHYAEGPLRYERRGDDFVLYSVGTDFEDNGGVRDSNPWDRQGVTRGDRVYWPLP